MKRQGRKSAAQTPAPKSEKIYGSSKNPKGSAMSKKSGASIKFTEDIIKGLEKKVKEHNEKYPSKKVRLSTLKAVFRRGAGAYSSTHRPTITGGAPNTRTAWSYARVNKFLEKKAGKKVKAAYIQDDDLLKNGGELKLLAPNGKPSNLTPEQYKLVRTSEFKKWFGDWENDPKNASKVVDENGEPLVVWHGSKKWAIDGVFRNISKNKINPRRDELGIHFGTLNQAKFVINQKSLSKSTIISLKPFFLNIRNLKSVYDSNSWNINTFKEHYENLGLTQSKEFENIYDVYNDLKSKQIDGFVYYNRFEGDGNSYIVIDSKQIKLADGTNTTFDSSNPDIRYNYGGVTNQNVICQRCGWSWNTKDSDPSDKYVCHKCGHDNSWYYGNELNDKGLLKSIYPTVKESLSAHGLIIDENYNLSEGSNKTFLPYFGMERHNDKIKKITITYYEDEMDVLGEIDVEAEDNGVDIEMDFPKFGIKEEIESFEKGGKMKEQIALPDSYSTYDKLEPILSKQGYVLKKKKDMLPVGKLAKGKTLIQIAKMHKVKFDDLAKELTKGIKTEMEHTNDKAIAKAIAMDHLYEDPKYYTKLAKMESSKKYESGGEVAHVSGKAGGYLVGRRHSEGGIKAVNKSNNQPLEMEGGEVVITRNAVSDNQKREFEGQMLTNREILSRINQSGGGVAFEKGGDVPSKCACRGKKYKYGGKMMSDFDIVGEINRYGQVPMKLAEKPIDMTGVKFADMKPSEAVKKLFRVDKLADGGIMEDIGDSVVLVTKKIPSLKGFTKMMKIVQSPFEGDNSFFVPIKKGYEIIYQRDGENGGEKITKAEAYKTYLFDEFGIKFKDLPSKIQNALFLGNQQLIDNYING